MQIRILPPTNCLITEFELFTTGKNHKHQKVCIADVFKTSCCTHRGLFCWGDSASQHKLTNKGISCALSVFPAVLRSCSISTFQCYLIIYLSKLTLFTVSPEYLAGSLSLHFLICFSAHLFASCMINLRSIN